MAAPQPDTVRYPVPSTGRSFEVGSKLLYCGDLSVGSTAEMRARALSSLGFQVSLIASNTVGPRGSIARNVDRVCTRLGRPLDRVGANRKLLELGAGHDVVWIDKGVTITRQALATLRAMRPGLPIIGYSPDNMLLRQYNSRHFIESLPMYTGFVTTKSFCIAGLERLGARNVVFSENGYDPATHLPLPGVVEANKDIDIGFVGYYEAERARSILALCHAGLNVSVFGQDWSRLPSLIPHNLAIHPPAFGTSYTAAICRCRIALCFLRKLAGDVQTQRSIEIPACGTFMLAERSQEHQALFEEGVEVDFFGDDSELVKKASRYIRDDELRTKMAAAALGRVRCGRYSYAWRLHKALLDLGYVPPRTPEDL